MNDDFIGESTPVLPLPRNVVADQKFGQLKVVHRVGNDAAGKVRLRCKCDCGRECNVRLSDLRSGHTKSCGCLRLKNLRRRFGKIQLARYYNLTALGKVEPVHETRPTTKWVAFCFFCNKMVIATTSQIRQGTKRCPCLKETYSSWRNMIQRCTNDNHDQYKDYGGRGIRVCDEWRNKFQQFAMDMGRRPEGKTLDRRDVDGPYNRLNCRWSYPKEQAKNGRVPVRKSVRSRSSLRH
jgi:hypothetical protein